jgi:hypothetical protein
MIGRISPARRVGAFSAHVALATAIALTAWPVATAVLPAHASGYTVSLTTSATTSAAGVPVTLTATSNHDVGGTPYGIVIGDLTDGGGLSVCTSGTTCTTSAVQYTGTTHTYVAYIASPTYAAPPPNVQATSSAVAVTYVGVFPWALVLTTTTSSTLTGQNVTLTAEANATLNGTGYLIEIFDHTTGVLIANCYFAMGCPVSTSQSAATTHTFIAYISSYGTGDPPPNVQVTSNQVSVAWVPTPSDACGASQVVVFDGYIGASYLRIRALISGSQTVVCYRAAEAATGSIGGNISISTPVPQVGVPTTDNNYQACQAAGSAPLVAGTVLGQPVYVDTYTSTGAAWVCLQLGPLQERIIAPVSPSATPSATETADPAGLTSPPPVAGPLGYPSGTCQSSGGPASTQLLDANVGGTQAWLSTWQVSSSQVDVCARVAGATAVGALITLTIPPVPGLPSGGGLQPVFGTSSSVSPSCTTVVAQFTSPTFALLSTSAPNQVNPAVVCVGLGTVVESVTVGFTGSPTVPPPPAVPLPTVSLDPDTP